MDTLTLGEAELQELTGYRRAAEQLAELLRQGFWRARRGRDGSVILERAHYDQVQASETTGSFVDISGVVPKQQFHANSVRRQAALRARTPAWADMAAIDAIYAEAKRLTSETGISHHVDHEIPLQGEFVSGLHVHANLRVMVGDDNVRKGNRFEPC